MKKIVLLIVLAGVLLVSGTAFAADGMDMEVLQPYLDIVHSLNEAAGEVIFILPNDLSEMYTSIADNDVTLTDFEGYLVDQYEDYMELGAQYNVISIDTYSGEVDILLQTHDEAEYEDVIQALDDKNTIEQQSANNYPMQARASYLRTQKYTSSSYQGLPAVLFLKAYVENNAKYTSISSFGSEVPKGAVNYWKCVNSGDKSRASIRNGGSSAQVYYILNQIFSGVALPNSTTAILNYYPTMSTSTF